MIIDLSKRFGLAAPDIIKGRKKPSGMDWRGYNAANPTESQKDRLGRWVGGVREVFAGLKAGGNEWVGLADIREGLAARGITREQQDAAFMDMLRHDSDVRIIPVANSKALKPRDREAALMLGEVNPVHAMSIREENRQWQPKPARPQARDLPPADVSSKPEGEPLPGLATRQIPQMIAIQRRLKDPNLTPDERARLEAEHDELNRQILGGDSERDRERQGEWGSDQGIKYDPAFKMDPSPVSPSRMGEQLKANRARLASQLDEASAELDDWDDSELSVARDAAKRLAAAADAELKKRKAAPKTPAKPRATARLTAKPDLDYGHMATTMRGLPVLPESEGAAKAILEPLNIPQLKAFAGVADVPVTSRMRKQELRDAIYNQLYGTRSTTDSVINYGDQGRFDRRRAEAAAAPGTSNLERLMGGDDTPTKVTAKPRTSKTREGSDLAATHAGLEREIMALEHADDGVEQAERRLSRMTMPQLREFAATLGPTVGKLPAKIAKGEAIRRIVGGTIGYRQRSEAINPGGVARRAQERASDGLDAKRRKLAELDAEVKNTPDMRAAQQAKLQADDLRREIGRIERGDDAAKVDQPREVTNRQITEKVAELVQETGRPYVSLVRLRAALPHIKHDEVTAALKELDRARIIQLDPDSDQKNVPLEAYEAAVVMGGQRRLLVSLIGGGGSAGDDNHAIRIELTPGGEGKA